MSNPQMNQPIFERWAHFDSNLGDSITVRFNANQNWITRVTDIFFQSAEGAWEDPSAFLLIEMGGNPTNNLIVQNVSLPQGIILPIGRAHTDKPKISSYFRQDYRGENLLTFSILDASFKKIQTSRLVLTLHIFQASNTILTN